MHTSVFVVLVGVASLTTLACGGLGREATGACSKSCHMHWFVTVRGTVLVLTVVVVVAVAVVVLRGSGCLRIIN